MAIDSVLDVIQRQIVRYKDKKFRAKGKTSAAKSVGSEQLVIDANDSTESDEVSSLVRVKRFSMKPMEVEEAIEQMELLSHDFFVFFNPDGKTVNVVYKRNDGNYGLIVPELE